MNIVAPRCKLAMDKLTRNLAPKFMTIKTAASLLKRNWPAFFEVEVAGKSFPRKQILFPEKSKINTVFHHPKCAKKLDSEESRTILLNGNEVIPSNSMPNVREVFVHTCFAENHIMLEINWHFEEPFVMTQQTSPCYGYCDRSVNKHRNYTRIGHNRMINWEFSCHRSASSPWEQTWQR